MSLADRQKLLADVKLMDELASVNLSAPASLRPGQEAQVTATVKGGHGVVGVLLLDTDLRFQARPIQAEGWMIVGPPKVWGGDGQEQTKWVDGRAPGLKKNLNSVLIFDQKTDLAARKLAEGKVVWTVKAPQEPGTYSITVAFHFGGEKASSVGTVTTPTGVVPGGGPPPSAGRSDGPSRSARRAGRGLCSSACSSWWRWPPRSATTASASPATCTMRSSGV